MLSVAILPFDVETGEDNSNSNQERGSNCDPNTKTDFGTLR
jgi:hypothetical protein